MSNFANKKTRLVSVSPDPCVRFSFTGSIRHDMTMHTVFGLSNHKLIQIPITVTESMNKFKKRYKAVTYFDLLSG